MVLILIRATHNAQEAKTRMRRFIIAALALLSFTGVGAQRLAESQEMTFAYGGGKYAPMWHMSNRQGLASEKVGFGYARLGVMGNHKFSRSGIGLDWGADVVAGIEMTSPVLVQQAYVDVSWKMLRLSVGQKERWSELGNKRLTSGALVESGNARPIPQVRLEIPEFWSIPGCKGWLAIKGHLAYGIFTDGAWQEDFIKPYYDETKPHSKNVLYHSKAGFMRFGNEEKFPLTAEIGLHMVTQFGGTTYNGKYSPGKTIHNPTRFKDFLLALIPLSGDELYDGSDQANVAGNVLGSWLGGIAWKNKNWELKLHYEHAFNDHSQMFWEYGLWTEQLVGFELELKRFKWIKSVALEYFNLKNQSGPIYHDSTAEIPDQISCSDNNYNHSKYPGWFNYGLMIATPLCTSPIYNQDGKIRCYNNRVEAFHLGIEGEPLNWLGYRVLVTRSNNWGTYEYPFKYIKQDTSGLFELTFRPKVMKNWSITASFAFDNGDLYGNNYGGMISIKRCGVYNFNDIKKRIKR